MKIHPIYVLHARETQDSPADVLCELNPARYIRFRLTGHVSSSLSTLSAKIKMININMSFLQI